MNKILVPTDFSIESLSLLIGALENENNSVDIVLVYGMSLPTSITELLFFSKQKCLEELQNIEFLNALSDVKEVYKDKINSITSDFFHGFNKNAFQNYLQGHGINKAYIPDDGKSILSNKRKGFDLISFIKKSDTDICEIRYPNGENLKLVGFNMLIAN
ncbi:hypothetical protein AXE80_04810 [Wenyingzhuangia fucanilytica]|uniref:UspA domain-containing protein n=1 Tax=Wenyingzhuangia fucanilytica TaxID=1790137 RepID=A0A1B1Y4G8_9FLAO|nr:hypothetical protein [Wenyingzhuangia fucanilytica]ANW95639.1 hypothetical protein AXE80_04810 [Wenyingzhuangia fucanilytica]